MIESIFSNPTISGAFGIVMTAGVAYVVVWFTHKKSNMEISNIRGEIEKVRLQSELDQLKREQAVALEVERVRIETARAHKIIADDLIRTNQAMNDKLSSIKETTDKTHEIANSAKTAQDTLVADLRSKLETIQVAMTTAAMASVATIQQQKDIHGAENALAQQKIAMLTQQIAQLTPQVLPSVEEGIRATS